VSWLYEVLLVEFQKLRKVGVKFTTALLVEVALDILRSPGSLFGLVYRDPRDDRLI
jgi:hypothetical protein